MKLSDSHNKSETNKSPQFLPNLKTVIILLRKNIAETSLGSLKAQDARTECKRSGIDDTG